MEPIALPPSRQSDPVATVARSDEPGPTQSDLVTLGHAHSRFRIPGDVVAKATAEYSDRARDLIKWASGYCRNRNLGHAEFGAMLTNKYGDPYSSDSVWKMFTGRREESELGPILDSIESLRRSAEETMGNMSTGFIATGLTRSIWKLCKRARDRHKLTFIFGESQIGKTTAITEYARLNNHGETIIVRMPTRGAFGDFLEELALRLAIPVQVKYRDMRRRVIESFDDRMLLIVDECHQCFESNFSGRSLATLEFCREIFDRRKCGVVLVGTNVLRDGITKGPNSRMLRQLWLRGYSPLQLPDRPSAATLKEFASAFGLEPAPDKDMTVKYRGDDSEEHSVAGNPAKIQEDVIARAGLGRWISVLQESAEDAKEAGKEVTWGRVIRTYAAFRAMETPE